jgi:hypothetical protein
MGSRKAMTVAIVLVLFPLPVTGIQRDCLDFIVVAGGGLTSHLKK